MLFVMAAFINIFHAVPHNVTFWRLRSRCMPSMAASLIDQDHCTQNRSHLGRLHDLLGIG